MKKILLYSLIFLLFFSCSNSSSTDLEVAKAEIDKKSHIISIGIRNNSDKNLYILNQLVQVRGKGLYSAAASLLSPYRTNPKIDSITCNIFSYEDLYTDDMCKEDIVPEIALLPAKKTTYLKYKYKNDSNSLINAYSIDFYFNYKNQFNENDTIVKYKLDMLKKLEKELDKHDFYPGYKFYCDTIGGKKSYEIK